MAKYSTGYNSIEQAIKDEFKRIGGMKDALRIFETGWYQICTRKEMNMKASKLRELVEKDPRFKALLEQAKKQVS